MRVLCKDQVGTVLSYVFTYGIFGGYRIDPDKIVDFAASEGYFFSIEELDEVRSEPDVARERVHNAGDAGQYSTRDAPNYFPKGF